MTAALTTYSFGPYRILGLLGRGGMGTVFLAEQTGPSGFCREVVLKLIRIDEDLADDRRLRLVDEAQLTALVDHPNVIKLIEVGEHAGQLYLALDRVAGINFLTLAKRYPGLLPPPLAAALLAQACEGLHAIHQLRRGAAPLNPIHRDVSPMNLMLDVDGRVRVIDLGIARADIRQVTTLDGWNNGNVAYMAPEHVQGHPLDRRADIYAAALVFWELCCGHPFARTIRRDELPPLDVVCPGVSRELADIVGRALAIDPKRRPRDASTLAAAFARYAQQYGFLGPAAIVAHCEDIGMSLQPPPIDPVPAGTFPADDPPADDPPESTTATGPRIILNDRGARTEALPGGRTLVVHTTWIDPRERGPYRLALNKVIGLLPALLLANAHGRSLGLHCEPGPDAPRAALYLDADQPHTRQERLILDAAAVAHSFDLGHRRHRVRRIACAVGHRHDDELVAVVSEGPLQIVAPRDCATLVVLAANPPESDHMYVEAICIKA